MLKKSPKPKSDDRNFRQPNIWLPADKIFFAKSQNFLKIDFFVKPLASTTDRKYAIKIY